MFRSLSRKRRFGFTLVEVLVTTVVIGVLAAVVLPALARQTGAADPARVSSDLNNIKMGIEVFSANMRPDYPGDLEDLVNAPSSSVDRGIAGNADTYANTADWKGPYVAQTLAALGEAAAESTTPWSAGAAGSFVSDLRICDLSVTAACDAGTASQFVTVQINGLSISEAVAIDEMLDGSGISSPFHSGMFRYTSVTSGSPAFYYTIPYTP